MRPIFQTIVVLAASLLFSDDAASQNPTIITLEGPAKRVQLQTEAMSQTVQVCGLELGKNYQIWVAQGQACQPSFSFGNQTYHASQTFQAAATCFDIEVSKSSESLHCAKAPIWLSIGCTDCAKNTASPFQKIAVTQALSPDALLNDIFIGGECYDVDNITAIGQPAGRGNFTNGTSSINIANGIVLSTGDVTLAEGPNNNDGISSNIGGPIFDADLEQLSGLDVYDVQGIEFDFVPTSNTVSFQYVFASEEYCEYVNQGASDHFGFFISGPGINGGFSSNGQNIATVPTTNLHVSIDNVSHLTNSAYFFPNRANCGGTTNMVDIQYDGWTSVLTASANVVPCQTYRIRLVIADVLDGIFDSAVFLSAGSFSAGGNPAQGELSASAGPTLVFENCNDGSFTFTRAPGSNDTEPLPINLTLLPSSTAELGLDFDPFPLTATIPAGANSVSIPVNVLPDNLNEGTETINVSVANNCRCNNLVFSLEINDPPALTAVLPDVETCEGTNFALTPSVSGGIPGSTFDYVWSNGQIGQTVTITPVDNQIISVTVTDRCGGSALASTVAEVIEAPSATLTAGGGNTCLEAANEPHELIIEYSGEPDWLLSYSINGIAQAPILATASPYTLTVNAPGDYVLTGVNSVAGGCPGTAAGEATLYLGDLQNTVLTTAATCSAMGSMSLSTTGGTAPYSYVWSNSAPDSPSANGLAAGNYLVTVTDLNGCSSIATGTVTAALPPAAVAVGSQVDCSADSDGSINLSISNGTAPFDFSWSNGLPNAQQQTGLGIGNYAVTITDAVGCTATATASVLAASTSPIAQAQSLGEIDCENQTTTLSAAGSTTGANIGYAWSGPGIVGQANSLIISAEEGGEYTAVVTDNSSGCSDTASVIVLADLEAPTAFAEGDTINCDNPTAILSGIGSSTGPDFQYEWTGTGTIAGGNTLTPTVTEAGVFTLTVTDETNGCTATASAAVADDVAQPQAVIAAPAQLTCTASTVVLDGSGSSAGPNFNYQWLLNGSPLPNENSPSLVASSVGVYTLLVENTQNGCAANVEVEVENDTSLPVVAAAADGQLDCSQSTVQLTASFQGDPADFDFAWATVDGSFGSATDGPTTLVNAGGTYTIIIVDVSSGCSSSANVVVNESNDQPNASILPAAPLDCNTGQVQLDASASAQGPGISFTWATPDGHFFTGENTLAPTVDEAGTYVLTVFDANNNCENQASVTVILDENAPSLNLPAAEMLTCGVTQVSLTSIVGNLPPNATLNYAWTSVDGEIVGAVDGANLLVAAPGTYSLEITNTINGCSTTASVAVDENVEVPLVNIAPADPITCETAEVTLDASGSSAGSNFSYEWTSPTGSFTSGQSLMNPTVDAAGTYNLLITNTLNECTSTGQVLVEASIELPDALANVSAMLNCEVEEVALSGIGSSIGPDFSYAWIGPGITADSTTLEPLVNAPGTYQLTVLNGATGCSATASVTVGQDLNLPTVAAGMDAEFSCTSVSLTLDGSGSSVGANFAYEWTSPNGSILGGETSLAPTVNAPGDYFLVVTNTANGCTATDSVLISPDADLPPVAIAQADEITCEVEEIMLDGTGTAVGADFEYAWSTSDGSIFSGANTLNPTVTAPGTYLLTVTNTATNCTNLASVVVGSDTSLPLAEAGASAQITCTASTVTLDGTGSSTGPGFQYMWTSLEGNPILGENSLTPSVTVAGTYQIEVTNLQNGCSNLDQVTVGESLVLPTAAAAVPEMLDCNTVQVVLSGLGSSSGSEFGYAWSTTNGNILGGANSLSPTVNEPGTYILTVTNNANNCVEIAEVVVNQDLTSPTAWAAANGELSCSVTSIGLSGTGSSTGLGMGYQWSTTDGNILSGANTLSPLVDEPGTYLLTVTNAVNGCIGTQAVLVEEDAILPVVAIAQPATLTCVVETASLVGSAAQGNDFSFEWTTLDGNLMAGATSLTATANQPGTYTLTVFNNENGCSNQAQTVVNQNITSPEADAGEPFVLSCNSSNNLDGTNSVGTGGPSFSWSTVSGEISAGANTATPTIVASGTYLLTVTGLSNGCTDTDEVTVSSALPIVATEVEQPNCFGDEGSITIANVQGGTPPYSYSFDEGASFTTQTTIGGLAPGTYLVLVEDANGCSAEESVEIEASEQVAITVSPAIILPLGDSTQINLAVNIPLADIELIDWNPGTYLSCDDCLNPVVFPLNTTIYTVTVVDKNGCEDEAQITVTVNKDNEVYVPNGFSPNGDGVNDVFMVYSNEKYPVMVKKFMVFSRWGESVFEYFDFLPNDPRFGWDGVHRGKAMDPAVFGWFVEVAFIDGSVKILEGDVTLVK